MGEGVGESGIFVGVEVGGTGVMVDVGGTSVAEGGTEVFVAGIAVAAGLDGSSAGVPQPTTNNRRITMLITFLSSAFFPIMRAPEYFDRITADELLMG
jgi:hypothetical protein